MTVNTGPTDRATTAPLAPSRTVLHAVLALAALSLAGAAVSVATGLSPGLLEAMGPHGRLSIPLPMMLCQVVLAALAGSSRRPAALVGSGLLAAALLAGVVSGFFDGGYADDRLSAAQRAFQVGFVLAMAAVAALAGTRFRTALRAGPAAR